MLFPMAKKILGHCFLSQPVLHLNLLKGRDLSTSLATPTLSQAICIFNS